MKGDYYETDQKTFTQMHLLYHVRCYVMYTFHHI